MRRFVGSLIVSLLAGCSTTHEVRYVYQDRDYGVIGLPENTDYWPTHYRRRAEKLMENHFPHGHEIVRAEEVIEGVRTVKSEESNAAEIAPQLPAALLSVVKLGHSGSQSQSDTMKLKECRIIYRRTGPSVDSEYASPAGLNPTEYIDPNAAERRKVDEQPKLKTGKG